MFRKVFCAAAAIAATVGAVSATAEAPAKVTVDRKTNKYCITDPAITGSRISHTDCRSADEWAKRGVTFAAPAKQLASR